MKTTRLSIDSMLCLLALFIIPLTISAQQAHSFNAASEDFLESLNSEERSICCLAFEDSLRVKWNNLPIGIVSRPGIQYGALSDSSKVAFHRLITHALSSQGYLKISSIMQLDDVLNELYEAAFEQKIIDENTLNKIKELQWGHHNFFIAFWGKPNPKNPWGFSLSGHHLSLNLTILGDEITMAPLFLGTDPSEVSKGKYAGWRILHEEEDLGFMMINSLTPAQKELAILDGPTPKDIYTNPSTDQVPPAYLGIKAGELTDAQKSLLRLCIQEYVHNYQHSYAHSMMKDIEENGFDEIYFAWIGSLEKHKPHYYMINGPGFLIEYDNVGFRKDGKHIHLIFREKGFDFGENLLQDHYNNSEHH